MDPILNIFVNLVPIRTYTVIENYLIVIYDLKTLGRKSKYWRSTMFLYASFIYNIVRLTLSFMLIKNSQFFQVMMGDMTAIYPTRYRGLYFYIYQIYNVSGALFLYVFWTNYHPSWYVILSRISTQMLPKKKIGKYSAKYFLLSTMIVIINSFQFFTITCWLWNIHIWKMFYVVMSSNWNTVIGFYYLPAMIAFVNTANQSFNLFCYLFHSQILGSAMYWKLTSILVFHLQNMRQFKRIFCERQIHKIMSQCKLAFYYVFKSNDIHSKFFSFYMAIIFPCTAYANIVIVYSVPTTYHWLMIATSSHFLIAIGIIHYGMAFIIKRMHQVGGETHRLMIHWNSKNPKKLSLFTRWKMALFVEKFHTKRKYGFLYWRSANISLGTFSKCCVIYSEMLMWSYKMVRTFK